MSLSRVSPDDLGFSVVSLGQPAKAVMRQMRYAGHPIDAKAKFVLRYGVWRPNAGSAQAPVMLSGSEFTDDGRLIWDIWGLAAHQRQYREATTETGLLVLPKLPAYRLDALGVRYAAVMHQPVKDDEGNLWFLAIERQSLGWPLLTAYGFQEEEPWPPGGGFIFLRPACGES